VSYPALTIVPRFYETDALGHISNVAIAGWLETARGHFLQTVLGQGFLDTGQDPTNWVLAALRTDFRREIFWGEAVTASVTDARVGTSSLTLQCEIRQGGELAVDSEAVLVGFDPETRQKRRLPDSLRERLQAACG
jgi:acyl-CoA thioester hydrolase